jgi:hypothetical protein
MMLTDWVKPEQDRQSLLEPPLSVSLSALYGVARQRHLPGRERLECCIALRGNTCDFGRSCGAIGTRIHQVQGFPGLLNIARSHDGESDIDGVTARLLSCASVLSRAVVLAPHMLYEQMRMRWTILWQGRLLAQF